MNEVGERIREFLDQHFIVVILGIVGVGLLLYGLTSFDIAKKDEVVFEAAEGEGSGDKKEAEEIIVVDVSGAVMKPGVYELASSARVKDALVKAGGMSNEADRDHVAKNLNLAAKVTDGAKIYIPLRGEAPSSTQNAGSGSININTASESELDTLSGVGKVTAQKIIDSRPYSTVEELVSKKIITKKVFDEIKEKISVF